MMELLRTMKRPTLGFHQTNIATSSSLTSLKMFDYRCSKSGGHFLGVGVCNSANIEQAVAKRSMLAQQLCKQQIKAMQVWLFL